MKKHPENSRFRGEIRTNIAVVVDNKRSDVSAPFLQSERSTYVQNSEAELQSFEALIES